MLVKDFDYELPEEAVAKYPPVVRGTTRLLVVRGGRGLRDTGDRDGGNMSGVGGGDGVNNVSGVGASDWHKGNESAKWQSSGASANWQSADESANDYGGGMKKVGGDGAGVELVGGSDDGSGVELTGDENGGDGVELVRDGNDGGEAELTRGGNNGGGVELVDSSYVKLTEWLRPGDVVILNDTKVMRARIFAELPDGRGRELVVLEAHGRGGVDKMDDDGGVESLWDNDEGVDGLRNDDKKVDNVENTDSGVDNVGNIGGEVDKDTDGGEVVDNVTVLYRGKIHKGDVLQILDAKSKKLTDVKMEVVEILGGGTARIRGENMREVVEKYGTVPLPPYLKREAEDADIERYQTVWARELGSAAAPTASLNMTEGVLSSLRGKGVGVEYLTLHVGLGTFLPIRTEEVEAHQMHSEYFYIPERTVWAIEQARRRGGRVVAVGTTVARTLEYWGRTGRTEGEDDIFIYPGYEFKVVDCLLTNFHAPGSTVLMLAAAFLEWRGGRNGDIITGGGGAAGLGRRELLRVYDYALRQGYKFLSYGDSMLIC